MSPESSIVYPVPYPEENFLDFLHSTENGHVSVLGHCKKVNDNELFYLHAKSHEEILCFRLDKFYPYYDETGTVVSTTITTYEVFCKKPLSRKLMKVLEEGQQITVSGNIIYVDEFRKRILAQEVTSPSIKFNE